MLKVTMLRIYNLLRKYNLKRKTGHGKNFLSEMGI